MKKLALVFLAALVVFFAGIVVFKGPICRTVTPAFISALTGLPATIAGVDIDIAPASWRITTLRLKNPPGFDLETDPDMIKVDEVYADFSSGFPLSGTLHLKTLLLSIGELRIIKNRQGVQNIRSLEPLFADGRGGLISGMKIDLFELGIRKVAYKDYTKIPVVASEFNVNISEKFEDITDARSFAHMIAQRALARTDVVNALSTFWQEQETPSVCFNETCVRVEIASTPESRQRGLMGREALAQDHGMLFIFPVTEPHSFWMKNMRFGIDIIWMAPDGTVTAVSPQVSPCSQTSCDSFSAGGSTRFVLEVSAGYAGNHGIEAGDKAVLPAGVADLR